MKNANDKSHKEKVSHQRQLAHQELQPEHNQPQDDFEHHTLHRLGSGLEFVGVLALAAWLGYYADKKFDSTPTLMIFFFVSSFVGMIYLMIKGSSGK